jgi:RasGEF domain/RasGEF N-terminal motif
MKQVDSKRVAKMKTSVALDSSCTHVVDALRSQIVAMHSLMAGYSDLVVVPGTGATTAVCADAASRKQLTGVAKVVARTTSQLGDLITKNKRLLDDGSGGGGGGKKKSSKSSSASDSEHRLVVRTRALRQSVVEMVDAAKGVINNPKDFMSASSFKKKVEAATASCDAVLELLADSKTSSLLVARSMSSLPLAVLGIGGGARGTGLNLSGLHASSSSSVLSSTDTLLSPGSGLSPSLSASSVIERAINDERQHSARGGGAANDEASVRMSAEQGAQIMLDLLASLHGDFSIELASLGAADRQRLTDSMAAIIVEHKPVKKRCVTASTSLQLSRSLGSSDSLSGGGNKDENLGGGGADESRRCALHGSADSGTDDGGDDDDDDLSLHYDRELQSIVNMTDLRQWNAPGSPSPALHLRGRMTRRSSFYSLEAPAMRPGTRSARRGTASSSGGAPPMMAAAVAATAAASSAASKPASSEDLVNAAIELIVAAHNSVWSKTDKTLCRKKLMSAASLLCTETGKAIEQSAPAAGGERGDVEHRVLNVAAKELRVLAARADSGDVKWNEGALSDAASGARLGLVDNQLRRAIWIDSNSVRALVMRLALLVGDGADSHRLADDGRLELCATANSLRQEVWRLLKHVETHLRVRALGTGAPAADDDDDDGDNNDGGGGKQQQAAATSSASGEAIDMADSIWLESSPKDRTQRLWQAEVKGEAKPAAASLNHLVLILSSDMNFERDFQQTFITTYRSFTTPLQLFRKLLERFHVPDGLLPVERVKSIQLRVAVVAKTWVNTNFFDFDQSLIDGLSKFAEALRERGYTAMADSLRQALEEKVQFHKSQMRTVLSVPPTSFEQSAAASAGLGGASTPTALLMASSEEEIARQLTLIDFTIFSSIEPSELLNLSWSKNSLAHRAGNVKMLVRRLNRMSYWFASMILWLPDARLRAKMYTKVLRILKHLRALNNFNGVMGIIAALNVSAVPRLKKTIALVDSKLIGDYKRIEDLMNPSSSYKQYRAALHSAEGPTIPYIGTFLTDLTFIEDGNPDLVDGLINFEKRKLLYSIVKDIATYQQHQYPFPPVEPLCSFLLAMPTIGDEKLLYDLSLSREKRS